MVRAQFKLLSALGLACLALFVVFGRDDRGHWAGRVARGAEASRRSPTLPTVIVLPDTQYYASRFPQIFTEQTSWIIGAQAARHITLAVQLGDIVDQAGDASQWRVASAAFRILDGFIPYLLVPGNHDTDANRAGLLDTYFPPSNMPWLAGNMTAGQVENSYLLVDIGRRRWLIVGLEFGPRDSVLAWADGVLKTHANLPAILVTHAYLYGDGSRYGTARLGDDDTRPAAQQFAPRDFGYTREAGINDGEQIWNKVVVPNPNVHLVLCGHDNGVARLTSQRADGSRVHQVLSDYQWLYQGTADYAGGSGYLRILEFDYDDRQVRVQTYSPHLAQYLTDDANQFALSLDI